MYTSICYIIILNYIIIFTYRCLLISIQKRKNYALWTRVPQTLLREIKYFQTLKKREGNVMTIAGRDALIVGSGRATITLPMGTQITIDDALLYPNSARTLLSFRDIYNNGFHVETHQNNK